LRRRWRWRRRRLAHGRTTDTTDAIDATDTINATDAADATDATDTAALYADADIDRPIAAHRLAGARRHPAADRHRNLQ
jgi:hypothetical protein